MDEKMQKIKKWGYKSINDIKPMLFELSDSDFKEFHSRLIPTVSKDKIIGVKTPYLRAIAKIIFKSGNYHEFLKNLPHDYYEEDNIHGFLIEQEKNFEKCISLLDEFLPYVDNWATCDMTNPKILMSDKKSLYEQIKKWAYSPYVYMVRFSVVCLMNGFLKEDFKREHIDFVLSIKNEDYYVKMAICWYFASALTYNFDEVIDVFKGNRITDKFIKNKSIQKALDSYLVDKSRKEYLVTLKIK